MRKIVAFTVLGLLTALPAFAQTPATERIRGTISAVNGPTITVSEAEGGDATIMLADTLTIVGVAPIAASDIKAGSYIGVGARPQPDGTLKAIQVFVFPENLRGAGEGHRDWVLPQSTMTNATVESSVTSVSGPTMKLTYKGGDKTVTIPPDAAILTIVPADRADVKAGAKVIVTAQKGGDGKFTSNRVQVAKGGAALPL